MEESTPGGNSEGVRGDGGRCRDQAINGIWSILFLGVVHRAGITQLLDILAEKGIGGRK